MNRSMWKTTLREIKQSLGRYLAIFAIIALGVGFFSGLKVTREAMVDASDRFVDDHEMYDFRLISTLGLTVDDTEALSEMSGVKHVSGAYRADAIVSSGSSEFIVSFLSYDPDINTPSLTAGRLPAASGEAVADGRFYSESAIGSKVTLSPNNTEDTLENFARTDFTIVGLAYSPLYLNYERGTTSVGNGSVSYFYYILPEDFDFEVYTDIYLTLEQEEYIYSDRYNDMIDALKPSMEEALTERALIRYNGLYSDASDELEDARTELADAEQKLADAHKEIDDGKQEIADGEKELEDAKAEIADKEVEIADAEKEIADNEQKLLDAEKEIAENEEKLADAEREIAENEKTLSDGEKEIAANEKLISDGEKELADGKAQLDKAAEQISENESKLEAAAKELAEKEKLINDSEAELVKNEQLLAEAFAQLSAQEQELLTAKAGMMAMGLPEEAVMAQLSEQFAAVEAAKAELEANDAVLKAARSELEAGKAALSEGKDEYTQGIEALTAGKAEYEKNLAAYESSKKELENGRKELEEAKSKAKEGRAELEEAKRKVADGRKELEDAKREVADGWKELNDGKAELEDGKQKLADARIDIEDAENELADARKELADGEAELTDKEQEFYDAKTEFEDAEKELADFKEPSTYVLTRNENIGYACFENDSKIVDGIAVVFPVFFFLVAALVCVTTMSRMIEEQRTQIGILKALGYSRAVIMGKYMIYSGSAAILGCIAGFFTGCYAFPMIIWKVYGLMYGFTEIRFVFNAVLFIISLVVSLICSVGTTYISCRHDLSQMAAELIRPKSPKSGKRIFLEYIAFLWRRIPFLHKVSIRNVFRYKGRFIMMLLGIGGCTGLLLTGFGIRDSITEIADEQYSRILIYDELVNYGEAMSLEDMADFEDEFSGSLSSFMPVYQTSVDPVDTGSIRSVNLVAFAHEERWQEVILLHDKTGVQLAYPKTGEVILTHNVAKLNNVAVGDTIVLRDSDFNDYTLKVSGICDNYFNSYAYIDASTVEQVKNTAVPYKSAFVNIRDDADLHETAAAFMNNDKVSSVNVNADTLEMFSKMMQTMNYIVVLVTACAAALAFIVLYNLTNINITERIREIATIKVLGFYPNETAAYVFRENMALTVFGAIVGIPIGIWLHSYVMSNIKIDMVTFDVHINPPSYLYAILFTFAFALFVAFVLFFKLKRIDMAESLKSIE